MTCPACAGPMFDPDPRGLVFQHAALCGLLPAEDATQAADSRSQGTRTATATELLLLAAATGAPVPTEPADVAVTVAHISVGVRRRTFRWITDRVTTVWPLPDPRWGDPPLQAWQVVAGATAPGTP